jgi:hypothetical protein
VALVKVELVIGAVGAVENGDATVRLVQPRGESRKKSFSYRH